MAEEKKGLVKSQPVKIVRPAYLQRWHEKSELRTQERSLAFNQYSTWLGYTDLHYARYADQWDYIGDHLEGRVLDDDRVHRYIAQRLQGESEEAFAERISISSYTPDFMTGCVTLAGMLFGSEGVTRTWEVDDAESLGNPETSDFGKMWKDCDGKGTNYESFLFDVAMRTIAYSEVWIMVDGVNRATGMPRLKIIDPQMVMRTARDEEGNISSIKVLSYYDTAGDDQMKKPEAEEVFTIFYPERYECWVHKAGEPHSISEEAYGDGFVYRNRAGVPVPPLFKVRLPFEAPIGYLLARKANTIFNHESSLDFLLHIACFPKFAADSIGKEKELIEEVVDQVEKAFQAGSSIVYGAGSKYIAPPMEPANIKNEILKQKRRDFFVAFFQAYADKAAQKTATEIKQDFSYGPAAFLSLLATTMEEAENTLLYYLEQACFPREMAKWGVSSAAWSKDYSQVQDPMKMIDDVVLRLFPSGKVPVDIDTKLKAVLKWLDTRDLSPQSDEEEDAVKEAIVESVDRQTQAQDLMNQYSG